MNANIWKAWTSFRCLFIGNLNQINLDKHIASFSGLPPYQEMNINKLTHCSFLQPGSFFHISIPCSYFKQTKREPVHTSQRSLGALSRLRHLCLLWCHCRTLWFQNDNEMVNKFLAGPFIQFCFSLSKFSSSSASVVLLSMSSSNHSRSEIIQSVYKFELP